MTNVEIRELSEKELTVRLRDERLGFAKMKLNHAITPVENPNIIKERKRLIARLLTEQKRRQLAKA